MTTTLPLGPIAPCPSCTVFTRPHHAEWDPGGMRAYYQCRSGHEWWKPWLIDDDDRLKYRMEMA